MIGRDSGHTELHLMDSNTPHVRSWQAQVAFVSGDPRREKAVIPAEEQGVCGCVCGSGCVGVCICLCVHACVCV